MPSIECVKRVNGEDKPSQKCIIPSHLFVETELEYGKYVLVKFSKCSYICRVNITTDSHSTVILDTHVVRYNKLLCWKTSSFTESISFPDCFSPISVTNLSHLKIKVFLSENAFLNIRKSACEDIVHKVLYHLVVGRDYFINCSDIDLAKPFNICGILVSEIFPIDSQYGKVSMKTTIELIDVTSWERIEQIESFKELKLGGAEELKRVLKYNLIHSKSCGVLVTGPSGSGKSSLVKHLCSGDDGFVVVINRSKCLNLSIEKCKLICEQFISYLKLFPERSCILYIDNLDKIVPFDSKDNIFVVSLLVYLLKTVKEQGVSIVATAVRKRNINSSVSCFFGEDVNLGIPSLHQRREILLTLTETLDCDVDYDKIARIIPGFVGHDLSLLIQEATNSYQKQDSQLKNNLRRLTTEDIEKALKSISPSILKTSTFNIKVKPIYWKDIGGLFNVKKRLQMCIELPLQNPEVFKKLDLPCPHGVLLFGPPGCCKTTLARGLATECNANFFSATPADIYSSYVGESEKNLVELFYQARLSSPSIIFLDELDSLVSQRKLDKKSQGIGEKVLSTLLNEMDGFGTKMEFQSALRMRKLLNSRENAEDSTVLEKQNDVIVIAATNRPDLIDDALLRPGRFDIILYVSPPNFEERVSILETLTKGIPISNIPFKDIAAKTDLFSGADLKNLCNEAKMNALRHDIKASFITKENFDEALKEIKPSVSRSQIEMNKKLSSKYGTFI